MSRPTVKRKIVQIACCPQTLYALADDGSLWEARGETAVESWVRIPRLLDRSDLPDAQGQKKSP